MSTVLTMLDRALIHAQYELDALSSGDIEVAESHCSDRAELLNLVYQEHDEESNEDYVVKLIALQGYNQLICDAGEELKKSIHNELYGAKKSTRAAKAYMSTANRQ